MKKIVLLAVLAFIFMTSSFSVSALTKDDLKEKILGTVEVNGKTYSLTEDQKVIVERYFSQNTISDIDATYINERIDRAINIVKNEGNINFKNYPARIKRQLKDLVEEIYANTSVKATLTSDGLEILNSDGTRILIDGIVKQTGYEESLTSVLVKISIAILIVGTCLIVKQVKLADNEEKI